MEADYLQGLVLDNKTGTPSLTQASSIMVADWLFRSTTPAADSNENIDRPIIKTEHTTVSELNHCDNIHTSVNTGSVFKPMAPEFISNTPRSVEFNTEPYNTTQYYKNKPNTIINQPVNTHVHKPDVSYSTPTQQPIMSSKHGIIPHKNKSLDAWIDELIPGVETQDSYSDFASANDQLSHALIKLESERDLPKIELPFFSGAAILWPKFVEQFYAQVHSRPGISDTRRMDLLQSHVNGEAKKLIQGLGYTGKNYALALKELKNAFGHKIKVARAVIQQITTGSSIQSRDPSSLRQFYISIRDCVTTLYQLDYMSDLTSGDILIKTARRLPADKISKWNEFTANILRTREPTLVDLQHWLKGRVDADFNPYAITLDYHKKPTFVKSDQQHTSHSQSQSQSKSTDKKTTLNTGISKTLPPKLNAKEITQASTQNTNTSLVNSSKGNTNKIPCCLCSEAHYLYRCDLFRNKSVTERLRLINDKRYCTNCLKPGHNAGDCFSEVRCQYTSCGLKHHSLLHTENNHTPTPTQTTSSNSVVTRNNKLLSSDDQPKVHFQLVEVVVIGSNGRNIKTYGLLDSASEITLIHGTLAKQLGLKGSSHNLTIKTLNNDSTEPSDKVSFKIKSANDVNAEHINITEAWTVDSQAFHCPSQTMDASWKHLAGLNIPNIHPSQVQLLIGINAPRAHLQLEVINGPLYQPFGVRTILGWSIMGVATPKDKRTHDNIQARVNLIIHKDNELNESVQKFWKTESFGTTHDYKSPTSWEDRKARQLLTDTTKLVDGHYEIGMLWKKEDIQLPNNRKVADKRFELLAKRLVRTANRPFQVLYSQTLNEYISKGYAHKIPVEPLSPSPRTWYIPHHGVQNENKPGKVRVVFDAASVYAGTSLNNNLMTGPDLLNSLFGMLLRFRLFSVAIAADVEAMFHQIRVPDRDTDSLRFLWKSDITQTGPPDVYAMNVHIFGATDSPCCASYAIKRTAEDNKNNFSKLAVNTILRDFYVDDLLKSVETPTIAINLAHEITSLLKLGGFHLHKWISNSTKVLNAIPPVERAINVTDVNLDEVPTQRTLGLKWRISEDVYTFHPSPKNPSFTKRGIVSTVCSIFDPCGFLSPFTIRAKILIQELWIRKLDWGDELPLDVRAKWEAWNSELQFLHQFKLPRHHSNFSTSLKWVELHLFCDASERSFGSTAFLRFSSDDKQITCSFVCSKTRVAPIKPSLSIPRLELQGAVLSIRLWNLLKEELDITFRKVIFWTDSNTVLQYVNNQTRRFTPFVVNRIAEIQGHSSADQWMYCPSAENPADCTTRGLPVKKLTQDHLWFHGPEFLWKTEEFWPKLNTHIPEIPEDDPEVKTTVLSVTLQGGCTTTIHNQHSSSSRGLLFLVKTL